MVLDVLIVDGRPESRRALADGLGPEAAAREAATGAAALAEIRRLAPDCLLVAQDLPDMSGLDLVRALRDPGGEPTQAVVMVAEPDGEAQAVEAMRDGAQDYIDRRRATRETLRRSIQVAMDRFTLVRSRAAALGALRESEERLRRREAELSRAHRLGRSGGHEVDLRGGGFRARRSPEYLAIHGLPPEAWDESHEDWLRRIHPEDRARVERTFLNAIAAARTEYAIDYRIVRPSDGQVRWVSVLAEIERDEAGRPFRMFATHTDVTERKLDEERLRLALEAVDGIVYDWDLTTGAVLRSGPVRRILGHDPEEVPPSAAWWHERTHPDDLSRLTEEARQALARREERVSAEYRVRHRDGHWIDLADRALIVYGPDGPVRAIGSTVDVSDRKRAEAALRESESRFRAVFENAGVGVGCVDLASMACLDVNEALCEMLGRGREELLARPWTEFTHPDDLEPDLSQFRRMGRGEIERYAVEKRYLRPDGGTLWARVAVSLVRDAGGAPAFEIAVIEDVTERREAEAALARSHEALEALVAERTRALSETTRELAAEMARREAAQAELIRGQKLEALGQLTAGIAHDFSNVLAAVLGTYRLIGRRTQDEGIREILRHGTAAAERGSALVRQLTIFARREQLAPMRVDPRQVLPGIEALIGHALGAGIALEVEVEDGVWPVRVDPHQLEVAMLNLAVNARDAMPGGGRLRIAVANRPAGPEGGDAVAFAVVDSGTGMAPEVLERATEPFFTTKEPGRGTGLGLAMVHGFAGQSGGALRLRSAPGEGTAATILLPRDDGEATPAPPIAPPTATAFGPAARGASILLVDDDDNLRAVTAAHLRDLGHEVAEAPGGEAALRLMEGGAAPDLVVTDVVMPGMDGAALAARLRALRPGLPVLFVTAHSGARDLGGEAVLRKPVPEAELSRGIRDLLARRRLAPG